MTLGGRKPQAGRLGKPRKPKGMASEQSTAKALGFRTQPGSGNYAGKKGDFDDGKVESFLGENKETKAASIRLEFSWLRKIAQEASDYRKRPFLVVDFANVETHHPTKWACIPLEDFKDLMDRAGCQHKTTE